MFIRQAFCFEQEAKPVNGVLKIRLRRCAAALLQFVEIIFNLLGIEFCWQALKVKSDRCHMPAVIIEGAGTSAKDGNVAFKALE